MVYHSLLLLFLCAKISAFPKRANEDDRLTADENQEIFKTLLWCQQSPCKRSKSKYPINSNNSALFDHSAKPLFSSLDSNFLISNLDEPNIIALPPIFTELSISLLVYFPCVK